MEWQSIETAPSDEPVMIRTSAGRELMARITWGFDDEDGHDHWAWVAVGDDYPDCWSDGVCWESNAEGKRSDQVIGWRPTPPSYQRPVERE